MDVDITPDTARQGEREAAEPTRRWGGHVRFVLRILGILFAAALMLVLLGLLFSPSYWRF
jgi:hypothetical protein